MNETIQESPKEFKKVSKFKKYLILFAVGTLVSFVATTALRFSLVKDSSVHYHANFALYINGQQDQFKSFTFYEEVASCDSHEFDNPKVRSHMHDQNNHLIHVHARGVTWTSFMANLGYTLGDNLIKTDNGTYISGDDGNKLTFYLNGQKIENIANTVIKSEDVMLVSYGKDDDTTLKVRHDAIPRDAHKANTTKDPAACSGGQELTTWSKLKQALGVPPAEH